MTFPGLGPGAKMYQISLKIVVEIYAARFRPKDTSSLLKAGLYYTLNSRDADSLLDRQQMPFA